MRVEARDHGKQCAASGTPNDSLSVGLTARAPPPSLRRDGAKATKYSIGACFMTSLERSRTSVACEVKLYLALPFPSSSRLALPGLIASSSSVLGRAHSGAATATLGGPAPGPRTSRSSFSPRTIDRTLGVLASGPAPESTPCIPTAAQKDRGEPSATSIRSRSARSNCAGAGHAPELGRTSARARTPRPGSAPSEPRPRPSAGRPPVASLRWPRGQRLLLRGLVGCGDLTRGRASCRSRTGH